MSTVLGRHTLATPYLLGQRDREEEKSIVRRPAVRRPFLRLSVMLLIILLLVVVVWVTPVMSQAGCAVTEVGRTVICRASVIALM
jgi:hypothetical protein